MRLGAGRCSGLHIRLRYESDAGGILQKSEQLLRLSQGIHMLYAVNPFCLARRLLIFLLFYL